MANLARFMRRLGYRLRTERRGAGLTEEDLMEHNFNPKQWQRLETGRQGASMGTLLRVCEVLGIDIGTLLGGLDEELYEERPEPLPSRRPLLHGRKRR